MVRTMRGSHGACGRGIHASLGHVAISGSVCLRLDPAHTRSPPALPRVCAVQRLITSCGIALHPEEAPLAPGTSRLALLKQDKCKKTARVVFLHSCSPAFALLPFLLPPSPPPAPGPVFAFCPLSLVFQTLHSLLGRARAMFYCLCAHVCPSLSAVDTRLSKISASADFSALGKQLLFLCSSGYSDPGP